MDDTPEQRHQFEENVIEGIRRRQELAPAPRRMLFNADELERRLANTDDMTFGREPRYACGLCSDTGWVTIYHPEAVKLLVDDPGTEAALTTSVVMCSNCDRMVDHIDKFRGGKTIPVFGDCDWHFNVHDPRSRLDAAAYRPKPDGYVEELAEFDPGHSPEAEL